MLSNIRQHLAIFYIMFWESGLCLNPVGSIDLCFVLFCFSRQSTWLYSDHKLEWAYVGFDSSSKTSLVFKYFIMLYWYVCPMFVLPSGQSGTWAVVCALVQFSVFMCYWGSGPCMYSSGCDPGVHNQFYEDVSLNFSLYTITQESFTFLIKKIYIFYHLTRSIELYYFSCCSCTCPWLSSERQRKKKATGICSHPLRTITLTGERFSP